MHLSSAGLDARCLRRAGVVAVAAVLCGSVAQSAASDHAAAAARKAPAAGVAFGGTTSQSFPVVIETAKHGKQVAHATIAIRLTCVAGGVVVMPDAFQKLAVRKSGKFGTTFGPQTVRNDDGTTTDFEGSISGAFNSSRSRVSGKWSFKGTDHDAAGVVTDTCDSGTVSWSAKQ